jgi:DNA repair protein RecN (Recombination protein N)
MLRHLSIRDVVLIEQVDLQLADGLTVMTGETGAGKSIILDALALVLGARSEARLVRQGAQQASVTASFELDKKNPVMKILRDQGIDAGDDLIIRRVVGVDGKSKAFINDQPVGVRLLQDIAGLLVDVHGQFDNQGLLDPATHLALLDRFAGHDKLLSAVHAAYADFQAKETALSELRVAAEKAQADEAFLRAAVDELEDLSPEVGEEEKLASRRAFLQQQEKLFEVLRLTETELASAENNISTTRRAVDKLLDKTGNILKLLSDNLDAAYDTLAHAQQAAENVAAQLNNDDQSLEQSEARLFALRALARKHHCTSDELPEKRKEFTQALMLIEDQGDFIARLEKELLTARNNFISAAQKLTVSRETFGEKLAKAIHKELAPLKLEKATFAVAVEPLTETQWGANGVDSVRFMVAMNPGQPQSPLHKTASGGEMARLLLAIKVVLAKIENIPVLVFDEVDTGIGGAVAEAVGERLAKLSQTAQVIVITHAPQVAARGAQHWLVAKEQKAKQTITRVSILESNARRDEIARMLSGAEISNEARAAADRLLAG